MDGPLVSRYLTLGLSFVLDNRSETKIITALGYSEGKINL